MASIIPCAQDTLLSVGSVLVLTSPGAPERRPEVPPVKSAVEKLLADRQALSLSLAELRLPALLDGGDVMFDGACLWVGLTGRTNAQAVEQLREALGDKVPVVGLPVCDPEGKTLHLKVRVRRKRMIWVSKYTEMKQYFNKKLFCEYRNTTNIMPPDIFITSLFLTITIPAPSHHYIFL